MSVTPGTGERISSVSLPPGTRIAERYLVGALLGSGGFGIVYRARDERIGRDVALKVLRSDRLDEGSIRRFRREAALARDVVSENVAPIFDFGVEDGVPFLVLELLPAGTLRDRIGAGPLPIEESIRIARGILKGLQALHARGILHRDLKPSNVLFAADGTVRVGDLGLAAPQGDDLTRSLAGDALLGTAAYLAPERALRGIDSAAGDLFAAGVVLFEMLSGRRPFAAVDSVSAILERCVRPAPPVRSVRPDVPRWLAAVVGRLLARDPADRYPSAAAALADLERRRATPRRRPVVLLSATLAVVLAVAGTLGFRYHSGSRFATLRPAGADPDSGFEALDRRGRTLWRMPDVDKSLAHLSRLARVERGVAPRLVTVLARSADFRPESYGLLSIVDAQTGQELRRVDLRQNAPTLFPGHSDRYHLLALDAIDLDGDDLDEIVASFGHTSSWPSFAVLWEPGLDRTRVILIASGHQVFTGARDVDGDGQRELLFGGYNSLLGRYPAYCAVALLPAAGRDPSRLSTPIVQPGQYWGGTNRPRPVWTRLLPRGDLLYGPVGSAIGGSEPTLRVEYGDRPAVTLGLDGEDPATDAAIDRRTIRDSVYSDLDESMRLAVAAEWTSAIERARNAVAGADALDDPVLLEAAQRYQGFVIARAGYSDEAERLFAVLAAKSDAPSEIAYTAATAYHLAGDIDRAVVWYRRGLGPGGAVSGGGRWPPFFLEGAVLALGEAGRWDEAAMEIERFVATYPTLGSMDLFTDFVRARQGLAGGWTADPIGTDHFWDTNRYLALESRWHRSEDPKALLADALGELDSASETRGAVRVLAAQLTAELGRDAEALAMARDGVAELAVARRTSTIARGLLPLARRRLARLEAGASPPEGARRARVSQPTPRSGG